MRKKSHIALARYLVRQNSTWKMMKYKKAFYFGSILPDLTPSIVTAPHKYGTSYSTLQEHIRDLTDGWYGQSNPHMFWRRMGIILHYLADYFTYPHNSGYEGSLKDHCQYEGDMKLKLRDYVGTREAEGVFRRQKYGMRRFETTEELFEYIEQAHAKYMKEEHCAERDCRWIVELSSQVLVSVIYLMEQNSQNGIIQLGAWAA